MSMKSLFPLSIALIVGIFVGLTLPAAFAGEAKPAIETQIEWIRDQGSRTKTRQKMQEIIDQKNKYGWHLILVEGDYMYFERVSKTSKKKGDD